MSILNSSTSSKRSFFYIEEEETALIAQYVDENLEDFAKIVQ